MDFPNTENGAMLKEMFEAGMDLTIAHNVDFFFNFTKKKDAQKMQQELELSEDQMKCSLTENDSNDGWILCCTREMIPEHDALMRVELEFDVIAEKYQGESDGWGVLQPD